MAEVASCREIEAGHEGSLADAGREGVYTGSEGGGSILSYRPWEYVPRLSRRKCWDISGGLLNPKTGRLLLLEHGRGWYEWINWVLDQNAVRHADKFWCWFNRDIGKVLEENGLVVEKYASPYCEGNLGTVWVVEARPQGWKGEREEG